MLKLKNKYVHVSARIFYAFACAGVQLHLIRFLVIKLHIIKKKYKKQMKKKKKDID